MAKFRETLPPSHLLELTSDEVKVLTDLLADLTDNSAYLGFTEDRGDPVVPNKHTMKLLGDIYTILPNVYTVEDDYFLRWERND